ncbi:hypothetical protein ES703_41118 [subsurface metagenome]
MHYRYSLTVPPNTDQATPVRTVMKVGPGILHSMYIAFPPGCAGLVHIFVTHWEQQLWPWNTDEQYAWDDYTVPLEYLNVGVTTPPYLFHLCGWSQDNTFPHKIVCRLGIKRPLPTRPGSWLGRLLQGEEGV